MQSRIWTASLAVCLFVFNTSASRADDDDRKPHGQAPLEVLVDRLHDPAGIAIAPDGTLYFTETDRGTLHQRAPDGTIKQITNRLNKPRGIAFAPDGSLLTLADEWRPQSAPKQKGVLLRWNAAGVPAVLASGFREPQQITVSPEEIVISTRKGVRDARANEKDDDDRDHDRPDGAVFRLNLAGAIQSSAPGFEAPSGLVIDSDRSLLVVAHGASNSRKDVHGNLFRVTPLGELDVLIKDHYDEPAGLVRDALGNLFLAVKSQSADRQDGGRIVKIGADGEAHSFAKHFDKPWGLAFDAKGNLYVSAERQIYRFRAPAAPVLSSVKYLGAATVLVTGSAELRSVITIRGGAAESVGETDANGQFNLTVTLQPDRINKLLVYAIGKEGKGLASLPAVKEVAADFDPPIITLTATPAPNSKGWNNTDVTVTFTCADALSGVAMCPPPFLVSQEGANQIVQGTATDNAGNSSTASINISIDKTAPNIGYAIAPPANANGWYTGDVTVTFTCSDALSGIDICPGVLRPAGDGVGVTVRGTASDRAGNSAVSVAQLNVDRAPPSVVIQSPVSGSVVNAASVQVSGTVADATSGLASVACNNGPAIVSGSTFSCNVALHEGSNAINVTAIDRAGLMSTAGISVFMTPAAVAHVSVEQPPTGSTLTTPFQVWGWAIDPRATTGTGVDQVNVWAVRKGSASAAAQAASPVLLGTATYGLDRPDIRRTLGDRFAPSGYAFTVRGLAPGDYMLQVSARSTVTGAFDNVSTTSVKIPRTSGSGDDAGDAPDIGVSYNAHVQDSGWQGYVSDNAIAGTTGQSKRMEAIKIKLYNAGSGVRICYQAHVQNQGWQGKVCDDQLAGTEGQSLRMEALTVELQGAPAGTRVCYQAHIESIGWNQAEVCDGAMAGTVGQSLRIEAVRIRIINPPRHLPPVTDIGTTYQAHVQDRGWLDPVHDGDVAGTIGESRRMEALKLSLERAPAGMQICYQAHVEGIGWQEPPRCDGAVAGTEGAGLRMEAMRATLLNAPEGASVCYQAHVQDKGWMDEVCDFEIAGTVGESRRMEAVRIRISLPFHIFTDEECTNWVPNFLLQFPVCPPYRNTWLGQFTRWFASGFRSYFIGLPLSGNNENVFNPDAGANVPGQIFERGILHYWPEERSEIASMRLGEVDRQLFGVPQSLNAPMPSDFQSIFNTQGGLPVFGLTVSDPAVRNIGGEDRFSQFFERVRMERQPGTDKIEFGQLGAELLAAGLINREAKRKAKVALLRCGGCPKPLANQMPALGDGESCEEAYQDGERVCLEFFRCATAERRSCMDNTGF